jgi:YVTN family beta-propeller protein
MPLTEQGEVLVYLQPFPQEAGRLRFMIDGISARQADGLQMPLSVSIDELKWADLAGLQKLLATGILAPGSYSGISIQISKAFIQTQEGEVALLVPEQPVTVEHAFKVTRRRALTLFLSFNASKFITDEIKFMPVFSLASSGRGLINLTGLVSNSGSNIISALDQIRGRAYVAASRDDVIEVIDVFTRQMINRLKLNFKDNPIELVLTPDGRTLVSVNHDSNTVTIIDAVSMTEIRRITVGEGPRYAVVEPSGLRVFVLNSRSSTISVVDLTQRKIAVTIGVPAAPWRAAFNRNGSQLYVISSDSQNLAVVDSSRLILDKQIFIGMGAISITVDQNTDHIYVGKKIGGEIAVIDPFSSMFIDAVQIGGRAVDMTIDGEERSLLVALADRKKLQKINLTSKKLVAEIEVGEGAYAVVVMGER